MRSRGVTAQAPVGSILFDYAGLELDAVVGIRRRAERVLKFGRYGKKILKEV